MRIVSVPSRFTRPALRSVLAILALLSQLTLGSIAAPVRAVAATNAEVQTAIILCGATPHAASHPTHRRRGDPADDPSGTSLSLELQASILPGATMLPAASPALVTRTAQLPQSRAPPAAATPTVRARAPPILA